MNKYIGTPKEISQYLWELDENKKYQLSEYKEKRSLDSNAYAWVLIGEIAKKLHITKEEVYIKNIKEMGKYELLPIKNEAVDTFINAWASKGVGWICEILGESKIENYTNVIVYYGSSTYNTKEMSIFIDGVVQEAQQLGIDTRTPEQIEELKRLWKIKEN